MSIRIASRFRAVSTSVSPLETLDPEAETLTVSADNLFSANSNDIRVRVEFSKNKFTMVEPRSAGTFLIARSLISLNGSAVSRMSRIWSPVSDSNPSKSLPSVPVRPRTNCLEIVAVQRNVERALWHGHALTLVDHLYEPIGKLHAATLYSNEDQIVRTAIELDDLHRHALQGALDGPGVEDRRGFRSHRCTNMAPRAS